MSFRTYNYFLFYFTCSVCCAKCDSVHLRYCHPDPIWARPTDPRLPLIYCKICLRLQLQQLHIIFNLFSICQGVLNLTLKRPNWHGRSNGPGSGSLLHRIQEPTRTEKNGVLVPFAKTMRVCTGRQQVMMLNSATQHLCALLGSNAEKSWLSNAEVEVVIAFIGEIGNRGFLLSHR